LQAAHVHGHQRALSATAGENEIHHPDATVEVCEGKRGARLINEGGSFYMADNRRRRGHLLFAQLLEPGRARNGDYEKGEENPAGKYIDGFVL
jgi:hypothetical protein